MERRRTFFNDASKRRGEILTEIDSKLEKLQHQLSNAEEWFAAAAVTTTVSDSWDLA